MSSRQDAPAYRDRKAGRAPRTHAGSSAPLPTRACHVYAILHKTQRHADGESLREERGGRSRTSATGPEAVRGRARRSHSGPRECDRPIFPTCPGCAGASPCELTSIGLQLPRKNAPHGRQQDAHRGASPLSQFCQRLQKPLPAAVGGVTGSLRVGTRNRVLSASTVPGGQRHFERTTQRGQESLSHPTLG